MSRSGNAARPAPDPVLKAELLAFERRSQEQTNWILAVTLVSVTALTALTLGLDDRHGRIVAAVGSGLTVVFAAGGLAIRRGYYRRWFPHVGVVVQVTMVSAVIWIDGDLRGPAYALSSMPPFFYGLVVAITSTNLKPLACLLAGLLAASQFLLLYVFTLRPHLPHEQLATDPVVGWGITAMKAVVIAAIGVAAAIMAAKARRLLAAVSLEVRAQEELRSVDREMALAAEVQERLIPAESPAVTGLEITSAWLPARQVGGDWFDFVERGDGRIAAIIADVSGKGYPAALTTAGLRAAVIWAARKDEALEDTIAALNRDLALTSAHGRFVTLAWLEVDAHAGTIRYVNAGHNPPLLLSPTGEVRELDRGGPPLGVLEETTFESTVVPFATDDLLFAYTDGLSELRLPDGGFYGEDRLRRLCDRVRQLPFDELKGAVLADVEEARAGGPASDDLTFFAIRRDAARIS